MTEYIQDQLHAIGHVRYNQHDGRMEAKRWSVCRVWLCVSQGHDYYWR